MPVGVAVAVVVAAVFCFVLFPGDATFFTVTLFHIQIHNHLFSLLCAVAPDVRVVGYDSNWFSGQEEKMLDCQVKANPAPYSFTWSRVKGALPDGVLQVNSSLIFTRPLGIATQGSMPSRSSISASASGTNTSGCRTLLPPPPSPPPRLPASPWTATPARHGPGDPAGPDQQLRRGGSAEQRLLGPSANGPAAATGTWAALWAARWAACSSWRSCWV
ncbi:hypothetical protein AALO_G00203180 [Alosa alosa]|uniref:Ig-like domain-containing protein n=1 Tax=Alosa alosa TaxID=278164 RepID=A0AAV6G7K3_9TELE|nr:hypothetical protein AALO_G00203180 [Alosa alosa]